MYFKRDIDLILNMNSTYQAANEEIIRRVNMQPLQAVKAKRWLRFTGQILPLSDDRHAERVPKLSLLNDRQNKQKCE